MSDSSPLESLPESRPSAKTVWLALSQILDPEFGINIVDLGLIYSVVCDGGKVAVTMTLTTPVCPAGPWIHEAVRAAILRLPHVIQADANLVLDPPWTAARLSDNARRQLGIDLAKA